MQERAAAHQLAVTERRTSLMLQRSKLHVAMASQAADKSMEYYRLLGRLNVAMREETELRMDDGYEGLLMDSQKRVLAKQKVFSDHLAGLLDQLGQHVDAAKPAEDNPRAEGQGSGPNGLRG